MCKTTSNNNSIPSKDITTDSCKKSSNKLSITLNWHNGLLFAIVIVAVFVAGCFLSSGQMVFHPTDQTLVIAFVGILATFIVVGNIQQVSEIKHEMFSEQKTQDDEIQALNKNKANITDINNCKNEISDMINSDRRALIGILISLEKYKMTDLLYNICYEKDKVYTAIDSQEKSVKVSIKIVNNHVVFYAPSDGKELDANKIKKVSNVSFNLGVINQALALMAQPVETETSDSHNSETDNLSED